MIGEFEVPLLNPSVLRLSPSLSVFLIHILLILFSCSVMSDSFATPMDCSPPGSLTMGFPRQEYLSGLTFPSPGDLANPGIEPSSSTLAGGFYFTSEPPGKPNTFFIGEPLNIQNKAEMGLISPGGENLLDFLEERQVLSTYDGDLRDPLLWPQERPVPMRVARGPIGITLPSKLGPKTFCGVSART